MTRHGAALKHATPHQAAEKGGQMMPQLNEATALRLTSADEPTRPGADNSVYPSRNVAPLGQPAQPALISDLRIQDDWSPSGCQRRHAPSDDEDKALDAALDALARDLGVKLED